MGFALIVIVVAVILLIFLGFMIKKPVQREIESTEVANFLDSSLQFTSDCRDLGNKGYLTVSDLIIECREQQPCLDERDTCNVLEEILKGVMDNTWNTKNNVKGYKLEIISGLDKEKENNEKLLLIESGNQTKNSQGTSQTLGKDTDINIYIKVYY